MLEQDALEDPIKAVGGDGIVFTPSQDSRPLSRKQLAAADPERLVNYYSPIFVQQRVDTQAQTVSLPARVRHDRPGPSAQGGQREAEVLRGRSPQGLRDLQEAPHRRP